MNEDLLAKIKSISGSPGVYIMKNINGEVIYVGKAKNLKKRVSQYFSGKNSGVKTEHLVSKINDIETIISGNELEAFLLENTLIKQYKPKYNISLKDDKSYPYIKIADSKTGFPYIIKTRSFKKGDGLYFGPYSSAFAVNETIKTVNRIFRMRTCTDNKFNSCAAKKKPCLYYQIKRCSGPCCGFADINSYKKSIEGITMLLKGKNRQLIRDMKQSMDNYVKELNFEAAIKLRDKINAIIKINEKQAVVFNEEKDIDASGFYSQNGKIDITVLIIRNGRVTGTKNFFFKNAYLNDAGMLSAFLDRYYVKNLEINADIPDEIFVPVKIDEENKKSLSEYIKKYSGRKVKIIDPENLKRNKSRYDTVIAMASENAKKNFFEKNGEDSETGNASAAKPACEKEENAGTDGAVNDKDINKRHYISNKDNANYKKLLLLKDILRLNKIPEIIECFDISNISGTYAVASKAVLRNGEKDTSLYRRYRIQTKNTPDDYAMMYEALSRRFKGAASGKDPLPDVIMTDGGKGQLNVLVKAAREFAESENITKEDMPALIAIAKSKDGCNNYAGYNYKNSKSKTDPYEKGGIDKIYLPNRKNEVNFGKNKEQILMLMNLRDEAHRFAVSYFSKLKTKSLITSDLLNIGGVGKKIYGNLIKELGSVENIKKSSIEELSAVEGVNKTTAKKIYDYFHSNF
ncbi:MAG: excinuclease ABC subunit UvrC [Candidatus Acidulodesulfobacterium sp.]